MTYRDFLNRFRESKWKRNAQFGLGFALEKGKKPDQAIAEYSKLLADPKLVDLWTVRSRFQIGLGETVPVGDQPLVVGVVDRDHEREQQRLGQVVSNEAQLASAAQDLHE